MGLLLSQADSVPRTLQGALHQDPAALARPPGDRHNLDRCRGAVAHHDRRRGPRRPLCATGPDVRWADLPGGLRDRISGTTPAAPLHPTDKGRHRTWDQYRAPGGRAGGLDRGRSRPAVHRRGAGRCCRCCAQSAGPGATPGPTARIGDRELALALQRAILGTIDYPGFAARYEPADRPLEVGGDWYDLVELPDGRIGIVVGDCVGHGLEAATVVGRLRSACRALLLQDASPARPARHGPLRRPDPWRVLPARGSSAASSTGQQATYSSAGHPPGILAHPDGRIEWLDGGRSFAARRAAQRPADRGDPLPAGG